ncbi:putative nucleoporin [Dioscorea sansibarensis]
MLPNFYLHGYEVYDMRFELNEVEARKARYPSMICFLNSLNALSAEERDVSDRGRRFLGIFRFVYDHVLGHFSQRAYADPCEKWQLLIACLQHFKMVLSVYDITGENIDKSVGLSQLGSVVRAYPSDIQLPVVELMKMAWLLKLVALELHLGDVATTTHQGTCIAILSHLFAQCNIGISGESNLSHFFVSDAGHVGERTMHKCKVLELLEVVQFKSPDVPLKSPQLVVFLLIAKNNLA